MVSQKFPLLYATDRPRTHSLTRSVDNMAISQFFLRTLCSVALFLAAVEALKFDIEAFSRGDPKGTRCIRNFVAKDTLVVVTATVDGYKGDGMIINMQVRSWSRKEINWTIADGIHRSRMLLETSMDVRRM